MIRKYNQVFVTSKQRGKWERRGIRWNSPAELLEGQSQSYYHRWAFQFWWVSAWLDWFPLQDQSRTRQVPQSGKLNAKSETTSEQQRCRWNVTGVSWAASETLDVADLNDRFCIVLHVERIDPKKRSFKSALNRAMVSRNSTKVKFLSNCYEWQLVSPL